MLITTDEGMKFLQSGHFRVEADVGAATGPVNCGASIQDERQTAFLTYTRMKGHYAVGMIEGAVVDQDNHNATDALYGRDIEGKETNFADILNGETAVYDAAVCKLLATIQGAETRAKAQSGSQEK